LPTRACNRCTRAGDVVAYEGRRSEDERTSCGPSGPYCRALIDEGYQLCTRDLISAPRRSTIFAARSAAVVVGDLSSAVETRSVANQVNAMARMDAVIHNTGNSSTTGRSPTPEGHATILTAPTSEAFDIEATVP
jgi:hypothetical protein